MSVTTATLLAVTEEPLSISDHLAAVESPECGAVLSFVGQVRNHDPEADGEVTALEYSAHPDAAEILQRIVATVIAEQGVTGEVRVAASHRVGRLEVGELALVVCTATGHRSGCYDLNRAVVERIKAELPVWKKQLLTDGTWVWSGMCEA